MEKFARKIVSPGSVGQTCKQCGTMSRETYETVDLGRGVSSILCRTCYAACTDAYPVVGETLGAPLPADVLFTEKAQTYEPPRPDEWAWAKALRGKPIKSVGVLQDSAPCPSAGERRAAIDAAPAPDSRIDARFDENGIAELRLPAGFFDEKDEIIVRVKRG